ncbi:MAG: hypothetical protein J6U54_08550 [Clostridiales bacterium]|nr:hypothetical protein [Clostridiales bacterium]
MVTKERFVELCKKAGYGGASIVDGMVTIDMVDASKEEVRKTFYAVKLLANKVGYKHSFRVCKLKEETNNGTVE